jgi:hypothetical protein
LVGRKRENEMNTIRVNGVTVEVPDGCSVSVRDGSVIINGESVMSDLTGTIKLEIVGDPISVTSQYNVTVHGNVGGDVNADNNVNVDLQVVGNVTAGNNVNCGAVKGDVTADNNVVCGNVTGKVKADGNVVCASRG